MQNMLTGNYNSKNNNNNTKEHCIKEMAKLYSTNTFSNLVLLCLHCFKILAFIHC